MELKSLCANPARTFGLSFSLPYRSVICLSIHPSIRLSVCPSVCLYKMSLEFTRTYVKSLGYPILLVTVATYIIQNSYIHSNWILNQIKHYENFPFEALLFEDLLVITSNIPWQEWWLRTESMFSCFPLFHFYLLVFLPYPSFVSSWAP